MSELKEHQFCESDEFFREYPGPLSNESHLYYLKSEADKVIARHKYKRCLAMARWCKAMYDKEEASVNDGLSWYFISPEMKYWERWRNRWQKLAEKFKPNNSTAR